MRPAIALAAIGLLGGCGHVSDGGETRVREFCGQLPALHADDWQADEPRTEGPFDDAGEFFRQQDPGFAPPEGWRLPVALGEDGFLTLELYSRERQDPRAMVAVVDDPSQPGNRAWQLSSPDHTDGVVIRTSQPLGERYRICARVGHFDVGTGEGANGYDGDERNGPRLDGASTDENGAYFGALFRSPPRPSNNAVAHHERIAFIDSDNNTDAWTKIWDPIAGVFRNDGRHPIMIGAVPATGEIRGVNGRPFIAFADGRWHPPGALHAVDAYLDGRWYTSCIERDREGRRVILSIEGEFRHGGKRRYEAVIDDVAQLAHAGSPHYWFAGDPHTNYYEGSLLIDDIELTTWRTGSIER